MIERRVLFLYVFSNAISIDVVFLFGKENAYVHTLAYPWGGGVKELKLSKMSKNYKFVFKIHIFYRYGGRSK